jgi:pimeloyl-ACP methyl ester carboxylesterase
VEHFIETNGIQLHYLDRPGDGTPILLMPGLTANCRTFDGVAGAGLTPQRRLLTPDLRGRGASDKPDTGYTMADHAADVIGMLDRLGIERAVIGGHSFGGLLSFYIAATYPERVERLVVIDAAIAVAVPQTRELIKPSLDRLGKVYPSFTEYMALIKAAPYFHGWKWDPQIESYYQADVQVNPDGSVQARAHPEHIAAAIEGIIAEPWRDHLDRINLPVLLLHALEPYGPPGAPPIVNQAQADETRNLLHDCRYVQVPGNHFTMLYGRGAYAIAAAIIDFVL